MTINEVMAELKRLGNEQTRKTWLRHGAKGDLFGVKIGDLKVVVKKIKSDQALALELYRSGNLDAMYLAANRGQAQDDEVLRPRSLPVWTRNKIGHSLWPLQRRIHSR